MVNGNVLERRKRDGLGHWGSEGLAVPQPAPGLIPATGARGARSGMPGDIRGASSPGELQQCPSPTGFPGQLLPRGHILGSAGTELAQGCTQFGADARVPLGAR